MTDEGEKPHFFRVGDEIRVLLGVEDLSLEQYVERASKPSAEQFVETFKMVESGELSTNNAYKVLEQIWVTNKARVIKQLHELVKTRPL